MILSLIAGTEVLTQISHTTSLSLPIIFLTDFLLLSSTVKRIISHGEHPNHVIHVL